MIPASLPDLDGLDPEALKALVIAKHSESLEQHKELTSSTHEIEHLKLVIEKYRRMIFGRKSEKLTGELEQLEFRLEELETAQAAEEETDSKRRSRPARKPLPEDLPREVVTHLPAHNCCPDCGGALRQFGEDVSEQLERIPRKLQGDSSCAAEVRLRRLRERRRGACSCTAHRPRTAWSGTAGSCAGFEVR
jgi:transposase